MMEGVSYRLARESDRDDILEAIAASHGPEHAAEVERLWDWRWRDCPFLDQPGYHGGVGVWRDRIVVTESYIPAGLHRFGVPFDACWGVDVAAHPARLREILRENRDARKGRGGGKRVRPSIAEDLLVFRDAPIQVAKNLTLRMQTVAKRVAKLEATTGGNFMRNLSFGPPLRRWLGGLAPVVAFLPDRLVGLFPGGLPGAEIHQGDFDERFDALWDEAGAEYPIIAQRSATALNWRYRRHPFHAYTTIVVREGRRLKGYAVVTVLTKRGRDRGRVVDLFTRRGDDETAVRLLTRAARYLLSQGVAHADAYVSHDEQKPAYRKLGFKQRSAPSPVFVIGECEGEFYLTAGDGDGS